jgi:hypothetical protein
MDTGTDHNHTSPPAAPRRRPVLRFLRRFFVFCLVLTFLLTGSAVAIVYFYEDEVKEYVISELNKQLNTDVIVDGKDIDFTVLKNFPMASIEFRNVAALDAVKVKKDTLFRAGTISLQFSLRDIFSKNYRIRKIALSDARIRLRINKKGEDNFHFWKESSDSVPSAELDFALEDVELENVSLSYIDRRQNQQFDAIVKAAAFSGDFSSKQFSLKSEAGLFVEALRLDSISYLREKNVELSLDLNVDNNIGAFKIADGKLRIEDLNFNISGNVLRSNGSSLVNLAVHSDKMDIQSALSLIPAAFKSEISNYESEGEFYFTATLQGDAAAAEGLAVNADFGMKNASITQVKEELTLRKVNLTGSYSNGRNLKSGKSQLSLKNFSAQISEGSVNGNLLIHDLHEPSYSGKLHGSTTLEDLQRFLHIDTIENMSGQLVADVRFEIGKGRSGAVSAEGNLKIADATLKIKDDPRVYSAVTGDFDFNDNDLLINSFKAKMAASDVELNGVLRNLMNFITKDDQSILVQATLMCQNLDLNEILTDRADKTDSKYHLQFSDKVDVELNTEVRNLLFRKFKATDLRGKVSLRNRKLILDPITFNTMGGKITSSGMVDGSDTTRLLVTCFSEISRINVTQMFQQFENFGQKAITDQNIKGLADAKIEFASVLDPSLMMQMDKLYAAVDLGIVNGELNNVESFRSLSRFIELKELESIKFATLKNKISIRDQVITIPKMEIRSNALNVTASGTHSFTNVIDYHVKLSLDELLAKKARKAKKENDEFGEIADDGLGRTNIFLSMTGTVDKPVIRYDSKSAVQNVKDDIKVEKQNLKTILKEEFGMFKKDSTLTKPAGTSKEENARFRISWDEEQKKEEKKVIVKPKKPEIEDF